uniref:SH3 domain-containing protein n=1 Tax=Anopheles atroparvus TaxID=41427 RepID=A0AAG5DBZ8_ANOAO
MFSRLCKNTIFPTGINQSSATSAASSTANSAERAADATVGPSRSTGTPDASLPTATGNVGGSVAVVAAAIAADRRRRRQQLGGRNLPSLPVLPPRSRGPIRAPEPPPPYWAHYAHRPVPAAPVASSADRIGGAVSAGGCGGGGGGVSSVAVAPAAAAAAVRPNSASTTDDSDTSNDIPRTHRGRSTSGESSSTGAAGGAPGQSGVAGGVPAAQHHGGHERDTADARHRYNLRNQQRQRIKEHLLSQDAFCPDLVRNCKNITTDSPERQSSPTPGGEYAEVGELSRNLATVAINVGASTSAGWAPAIDQANGTHTGSTPTTQPTTDVPGRCVSAVPVTMGQNLSIRRPKISLTWVLREQSREGGSHSAGPGSALSQHQQTSQQPSQHPGALLPGTAKAAPIKGPPADKTSQSTTRVSPTQQPLVMPLASAVTTVAGSGGGSVQSIPVANGGHNHHHHHVIVRKKSRTRSKERLFSEKYVSDNNLSEYHHEKLRNVTHANEYTTAPPIVPPTKTTTTTTGAGAGSNLYRKSNRKNSDRLKKKERLLLYPNGATVDASVHQNNNNSQHAVNLNKEPGYGDGLKEKLAVALKNTYSEPSLYTTVSEPSASTKHRHHRHHHRRRRERYRSQRFGYEIHNVDEFLSKCSLSSPGNIPVVLSSAATLYQTRPGSYQIEIPLPLGMVVNAVFKNQNWLYVQTPHAEEGYVAYDTCLPLGILPSNQRSTSSSKPTPCWESNKDIFPKPCGNLTDSEKEIQQLRGGTRSEGRRTPRLKRSSANSRSAASITACNSERNLDSLYLRTVASNQPKATADTSQPQYAQLKLTTKVLGTIAPSVKSEKALAIEQLEKLICSGSGDYVHLLKQRQQQLLLKQQHYLAQLRQQQQQQTCKIDPATHGTPQVISGSNHLRISIGGSGGMANASNGSVTVCSSAAAVRQTLLAITENYCSEAVSVHKGDVVTLLACKEYQEKGLKNYKQWFFVRTRDGHEGYIPAEAAGHGFL